VSKSNALATVPSRRFHSIVGYGTIVNEATVPSKTVSVSVSVTILVLTPSQLLTLNDPLRQNLTYQTYQTRPPQGELAQPLRSNRLKKSME